MTYLSSLLNPPSLSDKTAHQYDFNKNVHLALQHLQSVSNASVITNPDFNTLGPNGTTPITQGDGDNAEFSAGFFVVGAANADYTITPTPYPTSSTINSNSSYYINVAITNFNGSSLYFYQRQPNSQRQYQNTTLTSSLYINNNQTTPLIIRMDVYSFYSSGAGQQQLYTGSSKTIAPLINTVTSTVTIPSLSGFTISSPYTEFRLNFVNLNNGAANIDIYFFKTELGQLSTPLY